MLREQRAAHRNACNDKALRHTPTLRVPTRCPSLAPPKGHPAPQGPPLRQASGAARRRPAGAATGVGGVAAGPLTHIHVPSPKFFYYHRVSSNRTAHGSAQSTDTGRGRP
jgi:hypothetical protein